MKHLVENIQKSKHVSKPGKTPTSPHRLFKACVVNFKHFSAGDTHVKRRTFSLSSLQIELIYHIILCLSYFNNLNVSSAKLI